MSPFSSTTQHKASYMRYKTFDRVQGLSGALWLSEETQALPRDSPCVPGVMAVITKVITAIGLVARLELPLVLVIFIVALSTVTQQP